MHDFGWICSPVDRAGTEAPPYRDAEADRMAAQAAKAADAVRAAASTATVSTGAAGALAAGGLAASSAASTRPATVPARSVAAAKPATSAASTASTSTGKPTRPQKLSAARGGKADNLQLISGVGPKLEGTLNGLGFYHFDQIANWNKDEVDWVDESLSFKGRIEREEWIPQAKLLSSGDMDKFNTLYGGGGSKASSTSASSAKAVKPRKAAAKRKVTGKPVRPRKLSGARRGKADNLQQISGVGPKLEKTLFGLGCFHFDQIADWNKDEVDWVDEHLKFKGRIERDEWIPQCKLLAAGKMAEFAKKYGTGGLTNKAGQTKSGTRTRKS